MPKLNAPDMTYRHCAGTVKKAVHSIGGQAAVMVDLASETVSIVTSTNPTEISMAVEAAGYPNEMI